ncbi:YciI family protein [Kribbella sp. NPDC026596]|uniref:YciI family protein n=1 Tax=Kribbella sp. NPDC026596 TaxID=3155122 RepID=UPI0033C93D15
MTYYMLRPGQPVQGPPMSDDEMKEHLRAIQQLEAEMKSGGAWVFGGRLHDPATATVVRAEKNDVLTTDGPFAETKDHLGGFYLIRTSDLDGALAWAGKVSALIRASIEVRPFVDEMTS